LSCWGGPARAPRDSTAARQASLAAPGGGMAQVRAAGTFIADTARRLDVYGTYSTPSLDLATRNGLVADAVASMQEFGRVWDIVKAVVPVLADFGTIPQVSASSAQHLVHPEYLVLVNGTPFPDLSMSGAAEDDTTFMVTFGLPGIGNNHAITFDVEYVGPGTLVEQKASYTGELQPRPYPVARITLDPAAPMIDVETDHSVGMTATLYDSLDRVIEDERVITWTSSQPSVATVSGSGRTAVVHGEREGLSTIRVTSETQSADFIIKVGPMPVDTIDIIPDTVTIGLGGTFALQAETRDSLGNILSGRLVEWSSSNGTYVTVSEAGVIEGVALGEATITATSEGKSNTAFVRVIAGAVALGTGASANHACALATGGALFCWGSNSDGQLGDGTATDRAVPTYASAVPSGLVQVVTGLEHSCALDAEGNAMCWGANDLGQLGDGTISEPKFAMVTGGHRFTKLAIGKYTTCGIATTGTTYCWGQRVNGTATTTEQPTPLAVSGSYVDLVGAPYGGACGRTAGGAMYCWGAIGWGQTAASQFPVSPTRFGGTMTFSTIVAGHHHQCGLSGGTAWCWGSQMDGVVGDTVGYFDFDTGEIGDVSVPVRVYNAPALVSLVAGDNWTCGLTSSGAAWCWAGIDGLPVLAGAASGAILPTKGAIANAAGLRFTQLTAGRNTACGMDSGGIVYCWGDNTSGQAGQGTFTPMPGMIPPRPVEDPVTP
jgi:alpha-tubulin suppressor-like RCC1 family protein